VNKQEALVILGATETNFQEVVLQKLFEHKQFLLKSVITPQVFRTRARKIAAISEAYLFLLNDKTDFSNEETDYSLPILNELTNSSLIAFYRSYEHIISKLKLGLMQNNDPHFVAFFCDKIADVEHEKLITLSRNTEKLIIEKIDDVKISDFINSGTIIKELLSCEILELNNKTLTNFPTLQKDIIRSKKYANFTINK
jgi:hypothetical protein